MKQIGDFAIPFCFQKPVFDVIIGHMTKGQND